jgi:hypothetical protein
MAKLFITEFADMPAARSNGNPQMVQQPCIADQAPVTIAVGANPSAAFNALTRCVRVHADSICSIVFGGAAATTSNARMAANQTEYFWVRPGDTLSVIANT